MDWFKAVLDILGQYGLPTALVIYFIWRDYEREKLTQKEKQALVVQLGALEKEMRGILTNLVSQTTAIIIANSNSMRDWLEVLKIRPCLADELAKKILEETKALSQIQSNNSNGTHGKLE